jgi:broad specificity phosphatase PhoE
VYIIIVFGLAWFFESQGTTTVVFVRHADIDEPMSSNVDTPLNASGRARAEDLAAHLQSFDVTGSVNAIYADPTRRTQQTAEPLAELISIPIDIADHDEVVGFMRRVLREHKREIILVVTHRNDIAPLIEELHGSKKIAEIGADDYDDVFVVVIPWFGKVKTLQHSY